MAEPGPDRPLLTPPRPGRRRWKRWVLIGMPALFVLALIDALFIEPGWIVLTRHETGDGPRTLSILHLTDIHFTTFGSRERRVLEIVDETRPDLIVITGDSVLHETDMTGLVEFLSRLKAPLGVYACPGNWEDWVEGSYDVYPRSGVRMLRGETVRIGDTGVELVGLPSAGSPIPASRAEHRIVLCHYPAVFPTAAKAGVDLVLSGHTHGGQVRLPLVGPLWLPFDSGGFEQGWYEEGGSRLYVSRGVGMSIVPVRFFCRPEVALHRFRH